MSRLATLPPVGYHHAQTLGGYCYGSVNETPQAVEARGLYLELSNVVCGWATTGNLSNVFGYAIDGAFNLSPASKITFLLMLGKLTFNTLALTCVRISLRHRTEFLISRLKRLLLVVISDKMGLSNCPYKAKSHPVSSRVAILETSRTSGGARWS